MVSGRKYKLWLYEDNDGISENERELVLSLEDGSLIRDFSLDDIDNLTSQYASEKALLRCLAEDDSSIKANTHLIGTYVYNGVQQIDLVYDNKEIFDLSEKALEVKNGRRDGYFKNGFELTYLVEKVIRRLGDRFSEFLAYGRLNPNLAEALNTYSTNSRNKRLDLYHDDVNRILANCKNYSDIRKMMVYKNPSYKTTTGIFDPQVYEKLYEEARNKPGLIRKPRTIEDEYLNEIYETFSDDGDVDYDELFKTYSIDDLYGHYDTFDFMHMGLIPSGGTVLSKRFCTAGDVYEDIKQVKK